MSEQPQPPINHRREFSSSNIAGVSVRAWLSILLTVTVCAMSLMNLEVKEPLYTLVGMAVAYYLGSSQGSKKSEPKPPS